MKVEDFGADRSPWGLRTIVAENSRVRLTVLPEAGAKICSLVHVPSHKELLWRNPEIAPRPAAPGSSYDDLWSGGWDELFPNDEAVSFDGRSYPDHGELWTAAWDCEIDSSGGTATLYLRTRCARSGCLAEKWISLADGEDRIQFRHRFTNLGDRPIPYLWKLHPAMAMAPGDRILVPASRFLLEPQWLGTLGGGPLEWDEPVLRLPGRTVDLRVAPPPDSRETHFYYGVGLRDGWCAVYDPARQLAAGLAFPKEVLSTCWVFASYGGWNNYYVTVLEPANGYPLRLDEAIARGECAVLAPRAEQEALVVFAVRQGLAGVSRITPEGEIE